MKFGLLLSTVLFLSGMLGWSGIPEGLAYRVVESPEVRVPTGLGWTSFTGSLLATKRHLLVYHPVVREPVGGAITQKGRIEVFERISLRKLGEVLPDPAMESGAGSVFVANDTHLAVRDKGVAIYDLHGLKLVRRIAAPKGSKDGYFADRLTVAGSHLLIHEPGADKPATDCGVVHVHDFATGKLLGKLTPGTEGAGFGNQEFEVSGDGRFLLYREAREYPRTPKDLFAADLKFPSTIVKVGELPFLKPFQSRPRVELLGKHLMISETYGAKPVKHMYDLSTRKRLYSVTGAGDWNGCAVRKNLLFVPKPDRSPSGAVMVRNRATGKGRTWLTPPKGKSARYFGTTVACIGSKLYISSMEAWFVYDAVTLRFLHRIDNGGWDLSRAEPVPVAGSSKIGFVFNNGKHPGPLLNSFYYNPQVMVFDPELRRFTHRLALEDGIVIGGGASVPVKFGRTLHAGKTGEITVLRPGIGGSYKLFSLAPSGGPVTTTMVASVSFDGTEGYGFEVSRSGASGPESVVSIPLAEGGSREYDIPLTDHHGGVSYHLSRSQLTRIRQDYETLFGEGRFGAVTRFSNSMARDLVAEGGMIIASVPGAAGPGGQTSAGAVSVIDLTTREVIRKIQPAELVANDQFGSIMAVDAGRVVTASTRATFVHDVSTGAQLGKFPKANSVDLSGNILVITFYESIFANGERAYHGRASGYDVETGQLLYTVPTGHVSRWDYEPIRLAAGSSRMLLGVQLHDLATGQYIARLDSPDPGLDDNYASGIAADGDIGAICASGQGVAYLFDLTNGGFLRKCQISDRPDGFTNYAISGTGVQLDAESGILSWIVPDTSGLSRAGIHLFTIADGNEVVKIVSPLTEVPGFSGTRTIPAHQLAASVSLDGDNVVFLQDNGGSMGLFGFDELASTPLIRETVPLPTNLYYSVSILTRRDTNYQLWSGPEAGKLQPHGLPFRGTGDVVTRRVPLPPHQKSWSASFKYSWANAPEGP